MCTHTSARPEGGFLVLHEELEEQRQTGKQQLVAVMRGRESGEGEPPVGRLRGAPVARRHENLGPAELGGDRSGSTPGQPLHCENDQDTHQAEGR